VEPTTQANTPGGNFEALFMAHYGFVCRTLVHFGVDPPSVEDIAQEVFVVVHRRFAEIDPARDVRSWLWGISRNAAHTHRRGAARAERKLRVVPVELEPPRPDERLELHERAAVVEQFLESLAPKLRDVFVLAEIEGLSAPEISAVLEVKLNTVYSRLRLARERFDRVLETRRARERALAARSAAGGGEA
jgi:RNA polymerase sigma-70 factor, ECF subfamily